MIQWQKVLRSLGFTESEARVYLISLELGPSSVQDLAKKAKISRVTVYAVIDTLMKNGLMSAQEKGKKKMYASESPDRLMAFVHGRVKNMETVMREMESSLQELKLMQRGEKPVVKVYEGREGFKVIKQEVLETKPKEIFEFGNIDVIEDMYDFEKERKPYQEKINSFEPVSKLIYLSKDPTTHPVKNKKVIILSPKDFQFNGDILLFGKKIALSTFNQKQISVLIESAELSETFKSLFKYLWGHIKE